MLTFRFVLVFRSLTRDLKLQVSVRPRSAGNLRTMTSRWSASLFSAPTLCESTQLTVISDPFIIASFWNCDRREQASSDENPAVFQAVLTFRRRWRMNNFNLEWPWLCWVCVRWKFNEISCHFHQEWKAGAVEIIKWRKWEYCMFSNRLSMFLEMKKKINPFPLAFIFIFDWAQFRLPRNMIQNRKNRKCSLAAQCCLSTSATTNKEDSSGISPDPASAAALPKPHHHQPSRKGSFPSVRPNLPKWSWWEGSSCGGQNVLFRKDAEEPDF